MSAEADPFIITEKKRSQELAKIELFIQILKEPLRQMMIDKIGDLQQYMSFDHFAMVNNIQSQKIVTSYGYIFGNTGIIYLPPTLDTEENIRVVKIIATMNERGVRNWILDYRGNGGGKILSFMTYISPFIETPFKVHEQKGRILIDYKQDSISLLNIWWVERPYCPKLNIDSIRVVVNNRSASSSEFSAYILKRELGAVIHGTTTASALTTVSIVNIHGGRVLFPHYRLQDDEYITPDTGEPILLK